MSPKEVMGDFAADTKYAIRSLAAAPGFTAIALLVLALGVGATVSVFSVVNAVLLRSLPYGHPEKLVYLWEPNRNFKGVPEQLGPNVPDIYDWQRLNHSFAHLALFNISAVNVVSRNLPGRVGGAFVSGNFFQTMEAYPALGRVIDMNDDRSGHDGVAVISDTFWRSQFASAPDIIGRVIRVNRRDYSIVGVMRKDFGYPFNGDVPYESSDFQQTDIWLPIAYSPAQKTDREHFAGANAVARLRPGVSIASAQTELRSIETRLDVMYPQIWRGWSVLLGPLVETIVGPVEKMLWLLLGAVAVVLLIAITNVANLLLARAAARGHELGIRTALGAQRSRIVRQLLTESVLLSAAGGALGVAFAYAAVHALTVINPGGIPRFESTSVDLRVLVIALLLSLAAGLFSGAAPAIAALNANVNDLLKSAGSRIAGGANRGRFVLIVAEVALSVMLLTASGLLIRSYLQLAAVNPGFSASTLTFRLNLDDRYDKPELRAAFYKNFLDKLQHMSGVRYAGASTSTPLSDNESVTFAEIRGFGRSSEMVESYSVTPDYREALGTPLLRGRDFNPTDARLQNAVMVNQQFVALYFPGRDPVGGQIRLGMQELDMAKRPWLSVVGVVADVRHMKLEELAKPQVFGLTDNGENFALASSVSAAQLVAQARSVLHSLDPALTLSKVNTMGELMTANKARRSFQTSLLTGFAALAVALALTGLYGLMSYSVKQRAAEIGVRLAVGCTRGGIVALILGQGLRLTAVGLLIGLAGSFGVTRLIGSWLFGVAATDPLTLVSVPVFMLVVAACACVIPSWNAMRVDPIQALRQE